MFGEAVVEQISRAVGVVDLELYGFLARPLYVCTASSGNDNQRCMSFASMSQPSKHCEGRLHYRCGTCAAQDGGSQPLAAYP